MLHKSAELAQQYLQQHAPNVDYWSVRLSTKQSEGISVRQDVLQPLSQSLSCGAFISIADGNGMGYAATNDLTSAGFKKAFDQANAMAIMVADKHVIKSLDRQYPQESGQYQTPLTQPWDSINLSDKISMLFDACKSLKIGHKIVDWIAELNYQHTQLLFIDSNQIRVEQELHFIAPGLIAVANQGAQTQVRHGGGAGTARQGGFEQLEQLQFPNSAQQISQEALQLLDAPECPNGKLDLLLLPSQMMLQIHESIGHPLELDRILGDERNYAGSSFVGLDMFGTYQYGSALLNVSFDPTISHELASYGFDDDGFAANKEFIIKNGQLQKPLGSHSSHSRAAGFGENHNNKAVANARASSWNRPTIDRMANLNIEPGEHSIDELISSIENGVLMDSNRSWSIDDCRNKFQFGCEFAQLIKNGELTHVVRNPNYRGISATFWQNLAMVGNHSTVGVYGTPNCGKGEPNQLIQVGHSSPACVFTDIDIFGGE